jgi:Dirigent-like protein
MVGRRFAVVSTVAAVAVMAVGFGYSSAAPKPQTISLLEVDTSFVGTGGFPTTSNAPPAVGQGFVSNGVLYKWAGVKKGPAVGNARVVCTVTSVNLTSTGGSAWTHCDVALSLPGGVIEVSGPLNLTAGTNTLPVVGGTGAYVGAQGVVSHRNIGGENSSKAADVIHLTN